MENFTLDQVFTDKNLKILNKMNHGERMDYIIDNKKAIETKLGQDFDPGWLAYQIQDVLDEASENG